MYSLATNTSPSNREPTFSIVIAAINCSEFIAETINSITPQLKEKDEIIIVDDNSSDNSLEIYKKLASNEPRISFFINPSKGVASSRNFGNSKAKNNFILPLDSDDLLKKDTLKCYRHYIEKYKNFDVFYGNCEYFNQEKTISYVLRLPRILNRKLAVFWLLCFPRVGCKHSASLYSLKSFKEVGGYDETFLARVDVDLALSFIRSEVQIKKIEESVCCYRVHKNQMSRNRIKNFKYWIKLIEKHEKNFLLRKVYTLVRGLSEVIKFLIEKSR